MVTGCGSAATSACAPPVAVCDGGCGFASTVAAAASPPLATPMASVNGCPVFTVEDPRELRAVNDETDRIGGCWTANALLVTARAVIVAPLFASVPDAEIPKASVPEPAPFSP